MDVSRGKTLQAKETDRAGAQRQTRTQSWGPLKSFIWLSSAGMAGKEDSYTLPSACPSLRAVQGLDLETPENRDQAYDNWSPRGENGFLQVSFVGNIR